jgi:hypothetical protein
MGELGQTRAHCQRAGAGLKGSGRFVDGVN